MTKPEDIVPVDLNPEESDLGREQGSSMSGAEELMATLRKIYSDVNKQARRRFMYEEALDQMVDEGVLAPADRDAQLRRWARHLRQCHQQDRDPDDFFY